MKPRRLVALGLVAVLGAYACYHVSPAYRRGNPLFYRGGRPNAGGRFLARLWSTVAATGLTPSWIVSLETRGRKTGRWHAFPVVLADHAGEWYVVSMLGERPPWVANVRASGGLAAIRHGQRLEVHLVEVPVGERAPILKAYLARAAGGRPHIPVDPAAPVEAFEAVAAPYPVFRIQAGDDR